MSFNIAECISKIIAHTVRVDYSKLIKEIKKHEFVHLKLNDENSEWAKVIFTTENSCIVEEVQLTGNFTRFQKYEIPYCEWDSKFDGWLDRGDARYYDALFCWAEGMANYNPR